MCNCNFVTFAPAARCNGNVVIGDNVHIGSGAIIKNGLPNKPLIIGSNVVVGAGAVVTKNVKKNTTVIGNPAKNYNDNELAPIFKKEIDKVKIIQSGKVNYWTGLECKKFEEEFANYFGLNYCITVANASLGLEAAVLSLKLKKMMR